VEFWVFIKKDMKLRISISIIILIFVLVFLIFYKGLKNSNIYIPTMKTETSIPIFNAISFDKNEILSSQKIFDGNQYYLVNIWASWCAPCRDEHIFLMKLSNKKNIEIIGLNYKDKKGNARSFLKELDNPYKKILLDEDGTIAIEWGAYGVPESFLIHKNMIIKRIVGPINDTSFQKIKEIIK
jgi:cytochrome c biogenesis protein CcmG/thiol:disulfide interchange protein DsbE|tara:strand:- start:174 stop:722 length:549 start_codon:yes stop_codon:yes gene_type:complete